MSPLSWTSLWCRLHRHVPADEGQPFKRAGDPDLLPGDAGRDPALPRRPGRARRHLPLRQPLTGVEVRDQQQIPTGRRRHVPAPDLNAVEGAWSVMKSGLGNHAATTPGQLETLVRSRLRAIQRRPGLINALLGQAGLTLEPPPP